MPDTSQRQTSYQNFDSQRRLESSEYKALNIYLALVSRKAADHVDRHFHHVQTNL